MIFLTAPLDLQETGPYESSLYMLHQRYGADLVFADRDLVEDPASHNATSKQVYDPSNVSSLYVLSREDGKIDVGVYRQWEHLSKKHGVQATLLFPVEDSAAELGNFTVSLLEGSEGSDQSFAEVTPEAVVSRVCGPMPDAWFRGRG